MRIEQEVSKKELRFTLAAIILPMIIAMILVPSPLIRAIIGFIWMVVLIEIVGFATFGKEETKRF